MAPGARVTGNLPPELTSFVGRRDQTAEVKRLLAGARLVTLTGVGGVGKSRLALRAAAELGRAFRDGVWLIRLDQLQDDVLVAEAVASMLGLQGRVGYSPEAALAEYLAGRQLLLVLDNCEHLVDAAAKLADLLLRAAAGLRVAGWVARLLREHANVSAAQDFCQAEPGEAEAGLRIALHVWPLYYWNAGHVSEGRYRLGQVLARAGEPSVRRARGLLLAGFLAAVGGDHGAAQALLEQGTGLAGQLGDPGTQQFAAYCAGHVCLFAGDLHQAIAHSEDGLAVLPAAAVPDRQRVHLLLGLAVTSALAAGEERAAPCQRELAALTEAGSDYIRRWYSGYSVWALGLAAWRRGDLDRATRQHQKSLRLREGLNDRMGSTWCVAALAWIAAAERQYERAAVLLGAATGLLQSTDTSLDGYQHLAGHQRDCERQARQALGEAAFQAAYHHRGLQLPAENAVGYALKQSPGKPPLPAGPGTSAPAAPELAALLSPREMQAARLVAQGHSNKDIAAELVISLRTAEGHVERILTKLGFTSRAQVAARVAASQPVGEAA